MNSALSLLAVPVAMVLVAIVTGLFNWNALVSSLRREEDEKRGQRIEQLEAEIEHLKEDRRKELIEADDRWRSLLRAEQTQRRRCESIVFGMRAHILALRGALIKAGIEIPSLPDIPDYD